METCYSHIDVIEEAAPPIYFYPEKKYMGCAMKVLVFFLLLQTVILSQSYIRFRVENLKAGPAAGPWMFELADPYFDNDDNIANGNYAYQSIGWSTAILDPDPVPCTGIDELTTSECIEQRTGVLESTEGIKLRIDGFRLSQYHHINTVNPDQAWNIVGQAGDERIYLGGTGEIRDGENNLLLRATDCRLSLYVKYTAPAGERDYISGSGWGVIDQEAGLEAWRNEFDNGTGQVEFEFESFSNVVQNCYGKFDVVIKVKPSANQEFNAFRRAFSEGSLVNSIDLARADIAYNLSEATKGGMSSDEDYISANQVLKAPGGTLPDGINAISSCYWQLGTTLRSFKTAVTLKLNDITGISNPANLRILKRANASAQWIIYSDYTNPGSGTEIIANNVTSFSEFAIGTTGADALPVELNLFRAEVQGESILLSWVTESEINNAGFEIQKKAGKKWARIGFVEGYVNSNSRKMYEFKDESIREEGKLTYRLRQIDTDGTYSYSSEIDVEPKNPIKYALMQNYPNPFNPSTSIGYHLPEASHVELIIYDLLGCKIAVLTDTDQEPGKYNVQFNAGQLSSGNYIYTLIAVSKDGSRIYSESKRLILMK